VTLQLEAEGCGDKETHARPRESGSRLAQNRAVSNGSSSPPAQTAPRATAAASRRRILGVGGALVLAAAGGLFVRGEMRQPERDYHAIRQHMTEMERLIRAHEPERIWLHVEGRHNGATPRSEAEEKVHATMLGDLDRLAHLDGFAMHDLEIEVHGDFAVARYRVEGSAKPGDTPRPVAGEVEFRRTTAGWEMAAHRLTEPR
jgi:hypothetical protein